MSLLYLLVSEEASAVKVGISIDPRIRAAQLPASINLDQSLEIEFSGGSASPVERMLHYLFREFRQPMPPGDGCTEWFRLDALPEIVQFLNNEGKRLGISGIRKLHPPLSTSADLQRAERQQAQLLKRKSRRLREEQRAVQYTAALAVAATHNAEVLAWIRTTFAERDARQQIVGILPPASSDASTEGSLFLKGDDLCGAVDHLVTSGHTTLQTVGGWHRIFSGSFSYSDCACISVSSVFLSDALPPDYDGRWPGAENIRAYLSARVAAVGSPTHKALLRLHHKTRLERARFHEGLAEAWHGPSTS